MERGERTSGGDAAEAASTQPGRNLSATQLLETVELIHGQLDAGQIGREEFEEKKAELLARLPID